MVERLPLVEVLKLYLGLLWPFKRKSKLRITVKRCEGRIIEGNKQ